MLDFHWMPVMFWMAAGLALLPAGLALHQSRHRSLTILVLLSQSGVFLLLVSLNAIWAAFVFIILGFLLDILALYIINSYPLESNETDKSTRFTTLLRIGLSVLLFVGLFSTFHKAGTGLLVNDDSVNLHLQSVSPDISLLLILVGLLLLLIFIALNRFIRRT